MPRTGPAGTAHTATDSRLGQNGSADDAESTGHPVRAPSVRGVRERALLPVLMFTAIAVSVMTTLGAPLVPTIAHEQGVSLDSAQWMLTATLLTGAVAAPVMGRLGDGPHRRAGGSSAAWAASSPAASWPRWHRGSRC